MMNPRADKKVWGVGQGKRAGHTIGT